MEGLSDLTTVVKTGAIRIADAIEKSIRVVDATRVEADRIRRSTDDAASYLERIADALEGKLAARYRPRNLREGVDEVCRNLKFRDEVTEVIADAAVAIASNPDLKFSVGLGLEFANAWDVMRAEIKKGVCVSSTFALEVIDKHDPRLAKPA